MRVIGTAGHVDHGKSTLVEALTGIHPDRLKEEREREMTIDLGFAWFELSDGEPVGVVDVPGHRDFIENMLAGVGGIDAAILVVAADEGVMPQTREHLAILDLLEVNTAVVAVTKTDLAEGPDWLGLVAAEVADLLAPTTLANSPTVFVSARTGDGLGELKQALQDALAKKPARPDLGRPRLPIDRVFSIAGFGTVVTGTLVDGGLTAGQDVEVLPSGRRARIRGLQTHKQKIERAVPGGRVAVNLSGLEVNELARGEVLTSPGSFRSTHLVDVQFRYLPAIDRPFKHNSEVKLFVGSAEVLGRARLLGVPELPPGRTGWLQLDLQAPVVVAKGDHYILRRPSPGETLGGGVVVDPHPARQHRRNDRRVIARLEAAARGTPGEILHQFLDTLGPAPLKEIAVKSGMEGAAVSEAIAELEQDGRIVSLDPGAQLGPGSSALVLSRSRLARIQGAAVELLEHYHRAFPLRGGMPREELKSRLGLPPKAFNALMDLLAAREVLVPAGAGVRLPAHEVRLSPEQGRRADELLRLFRSDPFNTPSLKDSAAMVGEDVLNALLDRGTLVQLSPEVVLLDETFRDALDRIRSALQDGATITVAGVRDLLSTSRKYALALMEYLDRTGVTVRVGDERRLR